MIQIQSGHLGCGSWRLKSEDGIPFLAHPQPFSRRQEFRLGPDQITSVDVQQEHHAHAIVRVNLTDERYFTAKMSLEELEGIRQMADDPRVAPIAKNEQNSWLSIVVVFAAACIVMELVKGYF